jgi:hypothetical protein
MRRATGIDLKRLEQTLLRQHNVVSRGQALECGMTDAILKHRLRAGGPWQKLLPGIYLAVTGAVTNDQREMAALLHAGPLSVITGAVAARRNGIRPPASNAVDVIVPVDVRCQGIGFVRVQRTKRMPSQISTTGPIRFVGAARAVADAARTLTALRDVRALVSDAVQKGLCPVAALHMELSEGPKKGSALLRTALTEAGDGIRSVAEAEFRLLLKRARLPMPIFNARLFDGDTLIAIVDCWWPDAGVAAEVDSREYHFFAADWQRTTIRHDRLTARGVLLLHFPPQRIRSDRQGIVTELRSALEAGRRRPPLPIKALPQVETGGPLD